MTTTATAYGLQPPGLADARSSVLHIYGGSGGDALWRGLLRAAGLTGHEPGVEGLERLLPVMRDHEEPAVQLAARALMIRTSAFAHLSRASSATRRTA